MVDVKQYIYDALDGVNLTIDDNPNLERKDFPYCLLRTLNVAETRYKNYNKSNQLFRIDIFSAYKGEKEVINIINDFSERIYNKLMQQEEIVYVYISYNLIDDKDQGPVMKHGILSINVETMEVPQ